MNIINIMKLLVLAMIISPLIISCPYAQSESETFKISTDVLDEFGGRSESESLILGITSGGQPGVIGISMDSAFFVLQGYVHTAVFTLGDANNDGNVSIADVIFLINYLFRGGDPPSPFEVGDVNCDGEVSIGDIIYLINYLFRGGPPPGNCEKGL